MFAQAPNLMVSLSDADDDSSISLLFGRSTHANDIDGLMQSLRTTAAKYNMTFVPKRYGKEIDPKDFHSMATVSESAKEYEMRNCEGMYGTSRSSYFDLDNARMIIRHRGRIDTNRRHARGRQIDTIFIENANGKRFRFPSDDLTAARVLTEHVSAGGGFSDLRAKRILEASSPMLESFKSRVTRMGDGALKTEIARLREQKTSDPFYATRLSTLALAEWGERRNGARGLAENNPVVQEFMLWTEGFAPDRVLLDDDDALDPTATDDAASAPIDAGDDTTDDTSLDEMNDSVITREDILLPNRNQGTSLAREVGKSVVHDDPVDPEQEHEPGPSYIARMRALAGMQSAQPY